jgi:beta-glucosidase
LHAPGRKGLKNFLAAAHHAALCQAEGGRIIRSASSSAKIGTTFSASQVTPQTGSELDLQAAEKIDLLLNRSFIEPLLGLGYPYHELKVLQRMEAFIRDGDEQKLAFPMDFIGIQNYTREVACYSYFTPLVQARIVRADLRNATHTLMNWEVYPESIHHVLKRFGSYKNIPELIVTENGAAFRDEVINGKVRDDGRKHYLQQYLAEVLRAKTEGVNVKGYFVWSFTDNFEWAEGYSPRFGLVYIDYPTQKRIIKSSGQWYSNFLERKSETAIIRNISSSLNRS